MHCGIGRGIRQKEIPQEKLLCRTYNKLIVSIEGPHRPECIGLRCVQMYWLNLVEYIVDRTMVQKILF